MIRPFQDGPDLNDPAITKDDIKKAFSFRDGKATGPDDTYGEFLNFLDDENIGKLTKVFSKIYNSDN